MRKWMIAILIAGIVLTAAAYILIPGTIVKQQSIEVNIARSAISRLLIENNGWDKTWLKDGKVAGNNSLPTVSYGGYSYSVTDLTFSSLLLQVGQGKDSIANSELNIIMLTKDSVNLDWRLSMTTSKNPFKRFSQYRQAIQIAADMKVMLQKMNDYFSSIPNVYGIDIRREAVVDSTLLSTYDSVKGYPSTSFIYQMIGQLRQYATSNGASITGNPMLNIFTRDSIHYLTKVALPVSKKLPSNGRMAYKWMLPGGNILVVDVTGGQTAIDQAFTQVEYFLKDYGRQAPAIPFVSLVTDRMQQPDSSKWITRIYYPVMDL